MQDGPNPGQPIQAGIANDTPAANKIVILGLVPSIRVGDCFGVIPGIAGTRAAHEDESGGALRPRVSRYGRWHD